MFDICAVEQSCEIDGILHMYCRPWVWHKDWY